MDQNYNINQQIPPFGQPGPGIPGRPSFPPVGGQPPFTGPPFGQPPFGRPPIDRPPFGQPPFDRPPFEETPPTGAPIGRPPTTSPPTFTPQRPFPPGAPGAFFVDPGAIRPCLGQFVYIWLTSGQEFWALLVFVGPNSIAGWRWTGFNWVYFGTDLRNIDAFVCF